MQKAQRYTTRCLQRLFELRVLPEKPEQVVELRRLQWLADAMRSRGYSDQATAGALLLDWAARSPLFTKTVMNALPARSRPLPCLRLLRLIRRMWSKKKHKSFWEGRARSHLQRAMSSWSLQLVVDVAAGMVASSGRIRTSRTVAQMRRLPSIGSYLSMAGARSISIAMNIRLRAAESESAGMSMHTRLLHAVMDFDSARLQLRRRTVNSGRSWSDPWLAFVYCELVKLLWSEGVLQKLETYAANEKLFAQHLAGMGMRRFIRSLRRASVGPNLPDPEADALGKHIADPPSTVPLWSGGAAKRLATLRRRGNARLPRRS